MRIGVRMAARSCAKMDSRHHPARVLRRTAAVVIACAADMADRPGLIARLTRHDSRARRLVIGVAIYVVATGIYAAVAGPDRLAHHTQYNHYALLADAWLHGRQDLPMGPPAYAMNNDFVDFHGKTYISFPPLPAMLMLPFVKLSGGAEDFRDGQFVIWLAGLAPPLLFLVLEKLRRTGRSPRSERQNIVLSALFAFGSVYFFTAVNGFVWYAAMVVAVDASALFLLFALDAERPVLAGLMIGFLYLSRPPAVWIALVFALEVLRVSLRPGDSRWFERVEWATVARRYAVFAAPIVAALAFVAWTNATRYGRATPIYFDHEFLSVAWRARMARWGMLNYHFLAKNLGVSLTSLPWLPSADARASFGAPFKINEHGLALWFTTPLYAWLLWPRFEGGGARERRWLYVVVACAAALPAMMDLLYQNSGWRQFGYRFSNDYSVLLFVLLAIGARPMRWLFASAAAWGVAWNVFGAATFDKGAFDRFYFRDGSQVVVYQPD
jgi:hypothetical protein